METLNAFEKITLLISICIVAAANLFVLIEGIKNIRKNSISLKLTTLKNAFFVFGLMIIISSCSGGKFLNRKYTSGKFNQNINNLTHNTVYTKSEKTYASLNNQVKLKHSFEVSEESLNKNIINAQVSSIIKKDSIFIIQKKGKNKVIVVKNNLPDVTIIVTGNQKIIKPVKVIDQASIKSTKISKIKKFSKICLYLSFIPFLGFVYVITTRRIIKKYNKEYPVEKINYNTSRINLALVMSILTSIIGVIAFIYLFYLLFLANTMTAIY